MKVPRRFFVSEGGLDGAFVRLEGEELRHALRALRLENGEQVEALDGKGRARRAKVILSEGGIELELAEDAPGREPVHQVTLAAALLDSDAFDLLVRDAVQLGVSRIVPLLSERVRPALARGAGKRAERWRRIARESVKQCGRARVPEVDSPVHFDRLIDAPPSGICAWLDLAGLDPAPDWSVASELTLVVGPEGGWSETERRKLEGGRALVWTLGERVLRAETAAIAALARLGL